MTREQAIQIARRAAFQATHLKAEGRHDYLPTTQEKAETWQPHEWVVQAILSASVASDDALLRQALAALEHQREQTRPIDRTHAAIAALRARVLPNV